VGLRALLPQLMHRKPLWVSNGATAVLEESCADGTSSIIDGACIWGCSFRRGVALRIMRFLACIVHDSEVLRCCKTSSMACSLAALPPTVEESCQRVVSPFSASALHSAIADVRRSWARSETREAKVRKGSLDGG
jgi:hypothetical protein